MSAKVVRPSFDTKVLSPVDAYEATRDPGSAWWSSRSTLARSAFTAVESALVPFGSVTTGTSGMVSPPVPRYCCAIVWLVSQPSLFGTENSGSSASVAGPEAATPAIVKRIQVTTTVFLWARTQRVSEDKVLPPAWFACELRSLQHRIVYIRNRFEV